MNDKYLLLIIFLIITTIVYSNKIENIGNDSWSSNISSCCSLISSILASIGFINFFV